MRRHETDECSYLRGRRSTITHSGEPRRIAHAHQHPKASCFQTTTPCPRLVNHTQSQVALGLVIQGRVGKGCEGWEGALVLGLQAHQAQATTLTRSFMHVLGRIPSFIHAAHTSPLPHPRTSTQQHGVCQGGGHFRDLELDQAGTSWVGGEEDRGGGEERREGGKEGCCVAGTPARRDRA